MLYVNHIESDPFVRSAEPVDPYEAYVENLEVLAYDALLAMSTKAKSYRNVLVGSAMVAYNEEINNTQVFIGWNHKPFKGSVKRCAEMDALDKMNALNMELKFQEEEDGLAMGIYRPIGLVTVSNANKKVIRSVNKISAPTLHMCEDCQCYFKNDPTVNEETLINTTLPADLRFMEVRKLSDHTKPERASEIAKKVIGLTQHFEKWDQVASTYKELMEEYIDRSMTDTVVPTEVAIEAILKVRRSSRTPIDSRPLHRVK